jgi:hypothetical protein
MSKGSPGSPLGICGTSVVPVILVGVRESPQKMWSWWVQVVQMYGVPVKKSNQGRIPAQTLPTKGSDEKGGN